MPLALNYYYTNGTSYFSDAAHTQPCASPSSVYANFTDSGNQHPFDAETEEYVLLNWAVMSNGIYDVGFILDSYEPGEWGPLWGGGVIGHLTKSGGPNLISAHDGGRELQPSYWAGNLPGDPSYMATAGCWNAAPGTGRVVSTDFSGGVFTVHSLLGLWHGDVATSTLVQKVGFDATGYIIEISYSFSCKETAKRYGFWVNAPCIYSPQPVTPKFVTYTGGTPWTGGALTTSDVIAVGADKAINCTEKWGALVDSANVGIGMMSFPRLNLFDLAWDLEYQDGDSVFDPEFSSAPSLGASSQAQVTPYNGDWLLAPMVPGATYEFLTAVTAGTVSDIRSRFAAFRTTPSNLYVTTFTLSPTPGSLDVAVVLSATADGAVAGYLITESATLTGSEVWSGTPPASYTVASLGAHTLYAWAKDGSGNVSSAAVAAVTIQPPASSGVFSLAPATLQPAVAAPSLAGIQQGSFATPAVTLRPVVSTPTVIGVQQGSFSTPSVSLRPDVEPPTLQISGVGISSGTFTLPVLSLRPMVSPPSLLGMTGGSSIRAPSGQMLNLRRIDGSPLTILSI